jgi:hypothetical protein
MRKIDFREPTDPRWRRWRTRCDAETRKLIALVSQGREPYITDLYKKQKAQYGARDAGFFGKCAYCEQEIYTDQHGDLDHYRPKKRPREIDWSPVSIRNNGHLVPHPGYYWLAYDWRNLVLSCVLCNQVPQDRAYGKGERFPVAGRRAGKPGQQAAEKPLLLNPVEDDPKSHLEIDESCVFSAKTERGKVTIELLGLNLRDLPDRRKEKYREIEILFYFIMGQQKSCDWTFQELSKLRNPKQAFTAAAELAANSLIMQRIETLQRTQRISV